MLSFNIPNLFATYQKVNIVLSNSLKLMSDKSENEIILENRIIELEAEVARLKAQKFYTELSTVHAYSEVDAVVRDAEKTVGDYFSTLNVEPSKARIDIAGQRYILMRASSLSVDFFNTILKLYEDHGEKEAFRIGQSFLFDISHVIGLEDAANFHKKMKLNGFLEKLAAGPVHFAYSGWAYVEILNDSNPIPGEDFFLHYNHPYSFEADSWLKAGKKSEKPVCIMNAGYSSGWCESSAEQALTSVEISCKACGDDNCSFIMAPPHKIDEYLKRFERNTNRVKNYDIPSFFIRKEIEEKLKKAKEKAEGSEKAKTEFLANISHELRTPLNAIIGYSEMLKKLNIENEVLEYITYIDQSSRHLNRIVDDLLDLSKIDAGELLIDSVMVNLRTFFYQLAHEIKILSEDKWDLLDFEFILSEDCPDEIFIDITRLQQILYNLLSNAIKFTSRGKIRVSVERYSYENLLFSVSDSGIGIEKEKHQEIFEIFKQGDGSFTRNFGGSGLGLSICKKLVELMGGKIWVESEVNKGTSFYFSLPIQKQKEIQPLKPDSLKQAAEFLPAKIIIAEDNTMNRKLMELILKKAGHEVFSATDGFELLNFYKENQDTDLIITDLQMPGLSGIDAVKKLREEFHNAKNIPVIALTAHAMQEDKNKALEAGCDAYLTKPIQPRFILEKIQELLKK